MPLVSPRSSGLLAQMRWRGPAGYPRAGPVSNRGATNASCARYSLKRSSLLSPASPRAIASVGARLRWTASGGGHRAFSTTTQLLDESFDSASVERDTDTVDVCIIGGGPAGLAAAIKLKQLANASSNPDFRVLLLEKGSEIGSHIVSGNVLEPGMLTELFPDWNAPENPSRFQLATPVDPSKEILRFLTKTSALSLPVPPQMRNDGNFIISLSRLCNWLGERAEELGVEIYPGFSGSELLYTSEGSVRGVRTNDLGLGRDGKPTEAYQPGMDFEAPVTLLAEGCHGSLSKQAIGRFDLRKNSQPQTYGLGLKEIWEIEPEKFKQGTVVHSVGYPLNSNTYGGGFIYHFGENLASVGLVVGLDYQNPWTNPYNEFQKMKHHPLFAETLTGGSCLEYAARALVEGGFQSIPKCAFPGGALIGDSAGFVNLPKIKGTHNAIRSGILAAETCFDAINSSSKNGSQISLDAYDQMLRASPTWDELRRVRNYRPSFSSRLGLYGGLMYSGLEEYILRGKAPWTFKHHADYAVTKPADQCPQIEYPKPDGKLSFDIMTSVSRTGTIHEENEPVHLQVEDWDRHTSSNWPRFKGLEQRFCPAGVYEYVEDESKKEGVRFQINAQNCIHCKTCDIKAPDQDINWQTPQGGEGPKYSYT